MSGKSLLSLALFLAACFSAAIFGSLFTAQSVREWYPGLQKPAGTPPPWVFGPVWTVLYLLMAIAGWQVWERARGWSGARLALGLFFLQLALNALWSVLFFGLRNPAAGLAEITILWLAILATVIAFFPISRLAGWLMLPYLLWVSYASYLNFGIWRMIRSS
jgi:tryptophan-rich sensory protein